MPEQKYRKMMRTPEVYGYFTAAFTPINHLTVSASGNYTGAMLVGHSAVPGVDKPVVVNTPHFTTLNLKAAYDFVFEGTNSIAGKWRCTECYQFLPK